MNVAVVLPVWPGRIPAAAPCAGGQVYLNAAPVTRVIVAALEADSNNQTRAARRLGLSRRALIFVG